MANEFPRRYEISEELIARLIVVSRHEVTGLGHCQICEVWGLSPVAADDLLGLARLINVVNLARLTPKLLFAFKIEASEPVLLCLGTVLGIKLTSVD